MPLLLFLVLKSENHLDLEPGHVLVVDLRRARMWMDHRILHANYGYLAQLIGEGVIEWITPCRSAQEGVPVPEFPLRVVA